MPVAISCGNATDSKMQLIGNALFRFADRHVCFTVTVVLTLFVNAVTKLISSGFTGLQAVNRPLDARRFLGIRVRLCTESGQS